VRIWYVCMCADDVLWCLCMFVCIMMMCVWYVCMMCVWCVWCVGVFMCVMVMMCVWCECCVSVCVYRVIECDLEYFMRCCVCFCVCVSGLFTQLTVCVFVNLLSSLLSSQDKRVTTVNSLYRYHPQWSLNWWPSLHSSVWYAVEQWWDTTIGLLVKEVDTTGVTYTEASWAHCFRCCGVVDWRHVVGKCVFVEVLWFLKHMNDWLCGECMNHVHYHIV